MGDTETLSKGHPGFNPIRDGRRMSLPRITQPEPAQAVLLAQLHWSLPQQSPPRVYAKDLPPAGAEVGLPPAAA